MKFKVQYSHGLPGGAKKNVFFSNFFFKLNMSTVTLILVDIHRVSRNLIKKNTTPLFVRCVNTLPMPFSFYTLIQKLNLSTEGSYTKRIVFQPQLQSCLEPLFYCASVESELSRVAAEDTIQTLSRTFGPNIIRGRIEMMDNSLQNLDLYDKMMKTSPMG